ncbi:AAA family ATPase [Nocardia uniformis]|uniref:AAA family ATPase n=2 Tax=Nocardia uniformis TaxID=53432 RepID=A0A849BZZ2_9NOCA|nr:AAA family ATPase [Nocardia uniformis]
MPARHLPRYEAQPSDAAQFDAWADPSRKRTGSGEQAPAADQRWSAPPGRPLGYRASTSSQGTPTTGPARPGFGDSAAQQNPRQEQPAAETSVPNQPAGYPAGQQNPQIGQEHPGSPANQPLGPNPYGPGANPGQHGAGQAGHQPGGFPANQGPYVGNGAGQPQPYGAPPQYGNPAAGQGNPPPSLDNVPVRRVQKAPGSGWRRAVHHMSGGAINPGMSAEERRLQELVARIRQPVRGDYRIAVLSLKGGVGKTTTTMNLGSIFASIRGDRVIAVDANPDFGTLSQRVPLQTRSTVRDLLLDEQIERYSDVRRHTSQATSRLEVLASERDPAASEAFSEDEYRAVARILQRFYNIILTDCGTGLMHSAMAGVLDLAHSLVLISSSAIDGARSAAATLDWLSLHGHDHLVRNAVVVINLPRPGSPNVGIQQLREYFLARCRAVHIIPFDQHLAEGAEIDLSRLHKTTKRALVELAATVADDFTTDHRRYRG